MTSSVQLERETEKARNELRQTLEELRGRLTPGHLVDDGLAYAGNTLAGEYLRNLGRQAAASPLALCVAGAGLAWMMLSNGRPGSSFGSNGAGTLTRSVNRARERIGTAMAQTREGARDMRDAAGEQMEQSRERMLEMATWAKDTAASAEEKASSAYSTTKSRASSMAAAAKERATCAYEGVASTANQAAAAVTPSGSGITRGSAARARSIVNFCADHPLLLAGLGVAVGAVLGGAIPNTEAEDRLMGETSDSMKEQAQGLAQKQFERARAAGQALGLTAQAGEASPQQSDPTSAREATVVPSLDAGVLPLQDAGMEPEEEQAHQQTSHAAKDSVVGRD